MQMGRMSGWVALAAFLLSLVSLHPGTYEAPAAEPPARFEHAYPASSASHLTISNSVGEIRLGVWNRNEVLVRAKLSTGTEVRDRVVGDSIEIWVKSRGRSQQADFNVTVPVKASVWLENKVGEICVKGLAGHLKADSVDGDVHMIDMRSPSVEAKVIGGDIFFEGDFVGAGPYTFQSMRGDLDLTLPSTTSFNFAARALRESINLGQFQCNQCKQQREFIAGNHLRGGPKVVLTAYYGRILLHQK